MKLIVPFLVLFSIILASQNNANAIKCYVCTNLFGADCEKVNNDMAQDCPGYVSCFKTTIKGEILNIFFCVYFFF